MKQQTVKRSRHTQNRLAYIAYGNPVAVRQLVDAYGYDPPENTHDLVAATKQLVRRKGRKFVKELVQLHPDRAVILGVEKSRTERRCTSCGHHSYDPETNYCGTCGHSAYTGPDDRADFLNQLDGMSVQELEERYDNVVQESNKDPMDQVRAEEVRLLWNALRNRKKEAAVAASPEKQVSLSERIEEVKTHGIHVTPKEALIVLGLTLTAGVLLGSAWKMDRHARPHS